MTKFYQSIGLSIEVILSIDYLWAFSKPGRSIVGTLKSSNNRGCIHFKLYISTNSWMSKVEGPFPEMRRRILNPHLNEYIGLWFEQWFNQLLNERFQNKRSKPSATTAIAPMNWVSSKFRFCHEHKNILAKSLVDFKGYDKEDSSINS